MARILPDPQNDAEDVAARTHARAIESSDIQTDGKRLVRVKVIRGSGTADREHPFGMAVKVSRG